MAGGDGIKTVSDREGSSHLLPYDKPPKSQ